MQNSPLLWRFPLLCLPVLALLGCGLTVQGWVRGKAWQISGDPASWLCASNIAKPQIVCLVYFLFSNLILGRWSQIFLSLVFWVLLVISTDKSSLGWPQQTWVTERSMSGQSWMTRRFMNQMNLPSHTHVSSWETILVPFPLPVLLSLIFPSFLVVCPSFLLLPWTSVCPSFLFHVFHLSVCPLSQCFSSLVLSHKAWLTPSRWLTKRAPFSLLQLPFDHLRGESWIPFHSHDIACLFWYSISPWVVGVPSCQSVHWRLFSKLACHLFG